MYNALSMSINTKCIKNSIQIDGVEFYRNQKSTHRHMKMVKEVALIVRNELFKSNINQAEKQRKQSTSNSSKEGICAWNSK